ncbi:MAG: hypothetical protein PVJ39_17890 [Gammaproteobacteria bacterium]
MSNKLPGTGAVPGQSRCLGNKYGLTSANAPVRLPVVTLVA